MILVQNHNFGKENVRRRHLMLFDDMRTYYKGDQDPDSMKKNANTDPKEMP